MKRMLLGLVLVIASCYTLQAQQVGPQWVTIKSGNLKCWQCKESLDKYLLIEKGLTETGLIQWKYNLLQGEIRIQYLPDRTNPQALRITLNNAGFDADTEKAEPEAYKKLNPACKRAEDGGGPQKGKSCHVAPLN